MGRAVMVMALVVLAGGVAAAQDRSQSEAAAREIAQVMQQQNRDCLAAAEPGAPDRFVAAMMVGNQLLVVSARYTAPALLRERVLVRDYRDVYQQLQGGAEAKGKLFVHDLGGDGLHLQPAKDRPLDVAYQSVTVRTVFNGDWKSQGLTEREYRERYRTIDDHYTRLLQALLAQARSDTSFD